MGVLKVVWATVLLAEESGWDLGVAFGQALGVAFDEPDDDGEDDVVEEVLAARGILDVVAALVAEADVFDEPPATFFTVIVFLINGLTRVGLANVP